MPKQDTLTGELIDFLKDLTIIVLVVLFIRTFLFIPFQINGSSMNDSYYDREFIIVDKLSYHFRDVERGDVVVFKPHVSEKKEYFIKRVIGIAGDKIKIEDGLVYHKKPSDDDYIELDEGYLSEDNKGSTFVSRSSKKQVYEVPEGEYFVMGDNRNSSTDSRTCFRSCSYPGSTNYITDDDLSGRLWLDIGYFDWIRVEPGSEFILFRLRPGTFSFIHPKLGINTSPKWLNSPDSWEY